MRSTQRSSANSAAANFLKSALADSRKLNDSTISSSSIRDTPKNPLQISQRFSATPSDSGRTDREESIAKEFKHPEKLIDEAVIFKAAMTSDYSKIQELSIIRDDITSLDNSIFR